MSNATKEFLISIAIIAVIVLLLAANLFVSWQGKVAAERADQNIQAYLTWLAAQLQAQQPVVTQ